MRKIIIGLVLAAVGSHAQPGPVPGTVNISYLYERSTIVCRGTVLDGSTRPGPEGTARVAVLVSRIYKGTVGSDGAITVILPEGALPRVGALKIRNEVLLFLNHSSEKADLYSVVDEHWGLFDNLPPTHSIGNQRGLSFLAADLGRSLPGAERHQTLAVLEILQGIRELPASVRGAVQPLVASEDRAIKSLAFATMISNERPGSVLQLAEALERDPELTVTGGIGLLSAATRLRAITNERALQGLLMISDSVHPALRFAALDAVRQIRSPHSVPKLIRKLDHTDPNTRVLAAVTLREITGLDEEYFPGAAAFLEREEVYQARWRRWWSSNAADVFRK